MGWAYTLYTAEQEAWPQRLFRMVCFGMALQGVTGFFWMILIGGSAGLQMGLLIFTTGVWICLGNHRRSFARNIPLMDRCGMWVLGLVLLSMGLRLYDPVRHAALGQSDAYVHLEYLKAILAKGRLPASYPAGFHWTVALPVRIFGWDPYEMARFGGAAWGGMLSLGLYVVGSSLRGRKMDGLLAMIIGTFVPQWYVLTKTGIGMFANQAGLVYLLACWDAIFSQRYWRLGFFSLALMVTVPMMFLHMIPFLFLIAWFYTGKFPNRMRLGMFAGFAALGAVFLVLLYTWMPGNPDMLKMVNQIILHGMHLPGYPQSMPSQLHPLIQLVIDYLAIKRVGMAIPALFLAGLIFFLGHIGALIYGIKKRSVKLALFWAWGSLAGWATLTGSTDFTAYQRSGWEFLMTTAIGLGWLGGVISDRLTSKIPCEKMICAGAAVLVAWAFLHPPGHQYPGGQEEEEWIQFTRWFTLKPREAEATLGIPNLGNQSVLLITRASTTNPIRSVTDWKVLLWKDVNRETPLNYLVQMPQKIKIVLVTRRDSKDTQSFPSHFSAVSPEYASRYMDWLKQYEVLNKKTLNLISWAEMRGADVRRVSWGDTLDVYVVDSRHLKTGPEPSQVDED
jgi:hypothetical protein